MTPAAPPSAEACAWAARLAPDGRPVAFALHADRVLVAPTVLELVDGVWHRWPERAHTLLRTRLHQTAPATELDRAVVQVCSRKLRDTVPTDGLPAEPDRPVLDLTADARASRDLHTARAALPLPPPGADLDAWLRARCDEALDDGPLATRARPVVALLLDPAGRPLEAARNTHGTHRLHHAEVNLVQRWQARHPGGPLPEGAEVRVSLQCCRLCAALLVAWAPASGLRVTFLDPEPGRFGRDTALQRRGWERQRAS